MGWVIRHYQEAVGKAVASYRQHKGGVNGREVGSPVGPKTVQALEVSGWKKEDRTE